MIEHVSLKEEKNTSAAKKVVKNTILLYLRMLITVGISLYTTRIVLQSLGSTDYGIVNLIAGVISMLSFLNNAMATSTQRYLSYYQGRNDATMLKKVFSNSLLLHILIGIGLVIILESVGIFLFDGILNIPLNKVESAKQIYHYMSLTVFFTVLTVPFTASLIANENMLWVAIVNTIEICLKLAIALLLDIISNDKLILYGILTASITIISFLLYAIYCINIYKECTLKILKYYESKLTKDLSNFAGWNLFGSICYLGQTQGFAVLLNIYFNPLANAAYGIANQISNQLSFFSSTLLRAINPQIMKSEGENNRDKTLQLSMVASKSGFFLLAIFSIPFIFEIESILTIWLEKVPSQTSIFCRLILIGMLSRQLTIGLQSANQAIGNIKYYMIIVGTIVLMNLPVACILLINGLPSYSIFISYIIIELIACITRLMLLRYQASLSIKMFVNKVLFKEVAPVLCSVTICYITTSTLTYEYRFIITSLLSTLTFITCVYYTGLCNNEKEMLKKIINSLLHKNKIFNKLMTQSSI